MSTAQNVTMDLSSMFGGTETFGWVTSIGVFIAIILTVFLLSKNFRSFILGSSVTVILIVTYWISRWIGKATAIDRDYVPIKWLGYIIGFIVLSILIGKVLSETKYVKEFETWMSSLLIEEKPKRYR